MPMTAQHPVRIESRPGKFQSEPDYVQAFWNAATSGLADYDLHDGATLISAFLIGEEDEAQWPALHGVYALAVWEGGDGFVCSLRFDRDGFEAWREACENAPGAGRGDWED